MMRFIISTMKNEEVSGKRLSLNFQIILVS